MTWLSQSFTSPALDGMPFNIRSLFSSLHNRDCTVLFLSIFFSLGECIAFCRAGNISCLVTSLATLCWFPVCQRYIIVLFLFMQDTTYKCLWWKQKDSQSNVCVVLGGNNPATWISETGWRLYIACSMRLFSVSEARIEELGLVGPRLHCGKTDTGKSKNSTENVSWGFLLCSSADVLSCRSAMFWSHSKISLGSAGLCSVAEAGMSVLNKGTLLGWIFGNSS